MTKLYSNNFDAAADGALSGWDNFAGGFVVGAPTLPAKPVSGAKAYLQANTGVRSFYSALGALGDQEVRTAQYFPSLTSSGFRFGALGLRSQDFTGNTGYRFQLIASDGVGLVARFVRDTYGGVVIGTPSTSVFAPGPTDLVHTAHRIIGNTLTACAWINNNPRPTAPVSSATEVFITVTDSTFAAGYPFVECNAASTATQVAIDNLVVTDGAGGDDFFYQPDTIAPTVAAAAVANGSPTIVALTMSEALNATFVPAASAFTVSGHTASAVAISGNTINITVSTPFINGEAARTVAYTQPGSNGARDLAGNLLASFSGQAITNNVAAADVTAPSLSTAQVLNSAPTQIVLTFNETLGAVTPAAAAFAVSGSKTATNVARNGAQLTLTCSSAYAYGDSITVTYTKPGTNPIQDAAGNQTNSFGPNAVTNGINNPGAGTVTFTPTKKLTARADSSLAANVAIHAFVHDKVTGALVGTKTGLTSSSAGIPGAFTASFGVAGTEYDVKFVDDANPRRRSLELITPL